MNNVAAVAGNIFQVNQKIQLRSLFISSAPSLIRTENFERQKKTEDHSNHLLHFKVIVYFCCYIDDGVAVNQYIYIYNIALKGHLI